jgi:hypothetical protein
VALARLATPLISYFYFFNLRLGHFRKKEKKKSEWSNCKNLEVWGDALQKLKL